MAVQSKMNKADRKLATAACGATAAALAMSLGPVGFSVATRHGFAGAQKLAGHLRGNPSASADAPATTVAASGTTGASASAISGGSAIVGLLAAATVPKGRKAAGRCQGQVSRSGMGASKDDQAEAKRSAAALADLALDVAQSGDKVDDSLILRVQRVAEELIHSGQARHAAALDAFTEASEGAAKALQGTMQDRARWASSMTVAMMFALMVDIAPADALEQVSYSDFIKEVEAGKVEIAYVQGNLSSASYTRSDGSQREVNLVPNQTVADALFETLGKNKVETRVVSQDGQFSPLEFLSNFAGPIAWLIAFGLLVFGGGGPNPAGMGGGFGNQLGRNTARVSKDGEMKTKFQDVAGCDGAKEELMEVVDFLKNTERYSSLGAKIPKGALLVGPPGTGKTLLAKAAAGEAGVPFYSVSASEFVEVFAGIGAARVRDLFAEAKKNSPCIIFIDEIDAVGRQRSAGFGQGNDEREQTVNQLLTEMDGFDVNNGVVVIAATNRADILDQALVRPGRFDRQIQVDPPDVEGRIAILKVHAKGKSLAPGVDLGQVARQTPGMSGADLANLLNEAAIVAARQEKTLIEESDIMNALERIMIGLEKKDAVMSEKKKNLVAYHEAGHAILGALMNDYDVVTKISIVPRGPAGGVTIFMPSEERLNSGLYSKEFLENRMCVALGGRIAEELINGMENVTTGASNDFQQCTQVAQAMVTQLGMSEVVGQRAIGQQQGEGGPFMGRDFMMGGTPPVSQKVKFAVDAEVKRIVDEQYMRGKKILESNRYLLDEVAKTLMDQEKMGGEELMKLIARVTAEGKLVAAAVSGERSEESVEADDVAAAFLGERVIAEEARKSRCLHPDKPLAFACADCPRKVGITAVADFDGEAVASGAGAAFLGERVIADEAKKSRCLHPDKPLAFACGDCPRKVGVAANADVDAEVAGSEAGAAFLGERVVAEEAVKSRCLHPDKPLPFACADCPRKVGMIAVADFDGEAVASGTGAAFLGERVVADEATKSRCLHPDKPLAFACADCPRKVGMAANAEINTEATEAGAAFLGERVIAEEATKSRCLHPDKPLAFACGDCPRKVGMTAVADFDGEAVASGAGAAFLGERVVADEATKSRCLHPDKPLAFACADCPRKVGMIANTEVGTEATGSEAGASFLGERVIAEEATKSRCLHPDKPLAFACADCPRKVGANAEVGTEAAETGAAFLGERVIGEEARKSRCLHPDKPLAFACADCPRKVGMTAVADFDGEAVASGAGAAFLGERVIAEEAQKSRCLHPDKPLAFACADCPRKAGFAAEAELDGEVVAAAQLGERTEGCMAAKKPRCLHPDKSGPFLCQDCPRRG